MYLRTKVGEIKLNTPLLLASGCITETSDFFLKAQRYGCAGIVTRSLKESVPLERIKTPAPRYAIFDQETILACEWGNEKPWTYWRDYGVSKVKNTKSPIVVSLSGRDLNSCCKLIKLFDNLKVDAYEINISCPHSGLLHGNLNIDIDYLKNIMKKIRGITKTPIWIKLSYSSFLVQMAIEAESLGADAIVCTNSIGPGMLIDTQTAKPKLGIEGGAGGVAGKAIFPIALWCVSQLSQNIKIPIVGCGGIFTADHVVQMLMAGASAVQLYTAPALKGPKIFEKIVSDLRGFFENNSDYGSIQELIGLTNSKISSNCFESPKPIVVEENCSGCGACIEACAFNALSLSYVNKKPTVSIKDNCISCNACVGVCPPKFNAIRAVF